MCSAACNCRKLLLRDVWVICEPGQAEQREGCSVLPLSGEGLAAVHNPAVLHVHGLSLCFCALSFQSRSFGSCLPPAAPTVFGAPCLPVPGTRLPCQAWAGDCENYWLSLLQAASASALQQASTAQELHGCCGADGGGTNRVALRALALATCKGYSPSSALAGQERDVQLSAVGCTRERAAPSR